MPLPQEEIDYLKATFSLIDRNGDGEITAKEWGAHLQALGQNPTVAEVQAWINEGDTDRNGSLNWEEYLTLIERKRQLTEKELQDGFRSFDKDGDGFISPADLQEASSNLGENLTEEEVNEMVREADKDGDGKINFEEFKSMMMMMKI